VNWPPAAWLRRLFAEPVTAVVLAGVAICGFILVVILASLHFHPPPTPEQLAQRQAAYARQLRDMQSQPASQLKPQNLP
jgi:hypothetical protein